MNKEEFEKLLEELLVKIDDGPGSHSDVLRSFVDKNKDETKLSETLQSLNESLSAIRIVLKYLMLDLEATRRERDNLRMLLEDRD